MKKTTDQRINELDSQLKELYSCVHYIRGVVTNIYNSGIVAQLHKRILALEEQIFKKEPKKTINSRFNNIEFILSFIAVFTAINTFLIITYINR